MTRPVDIAGLEAELAGLDELSDAELGTRYEVLTGDAMLGPVSREHLLLAVSYEIQRSRHRSNRCCGSVISGKHGPKRAMQ